MSKENKKKLDNMKKKDWFTELREKNTKMPVKRSNKDYQKVINSLYLVWDPKSKKISQECRKEITK